MGDALQSLGYDLQRLGEVDVALVNYRRAHRIKLQTFGAQHIEVAYCLASIGSARLQLEQFGEARIDLERAQSIFQAAPENTSGIDSYELGGVNFALAKVMIRNEREHDQAIALARRAQRSFEAEETAAKNLADVVSWLAENDPQ